MKRIFFGLVAVFSIVMLSACSDLMRGKDVSVITGNVFYLQRIALPDNAKLTVTLSDVSLADAPEETLSHYSYITAGQQVPLPFNLKYLPSDIKSGRTYNVSARIDVAGELIYISDMAYSVINDPAKTTNLSIQLISVKP